MTIVYIGTRFRSNIRVFFSTYYYKIRYYEVPILINLPLLSFEACVEDW